MKSMIRILGLVAVVATALVLTVPTADASCPLPTVVSTFGTGGYSILVPPAGTTASNWFGKFWQTGNFSAANSGTTQMVGNPGGVGFIKFAPAPYNTWYISGDLSQQGIVGCPAGQLTFLLQTNTGGTSKFYVRSAAANTSGNFDLSVGGDLTLVALPRPRVASSSRVGGTVNLNLNVEGAGSGVSGLPVNIGYQIVSAASPTDPGRDATQFAGSTAITPGTPTPFAADCSVTASDRWVSTRLVIDGVPIDLVSDPTRVECDPTMADPKFKNIERPARPNPRTER